MIKKILQFRNIGLYVLALTLVLFSSRKKKTENPKKILIVQLAKLGDMVCTTPMFQAVKNKFPKASIYVVGDVINKKVLFGNPNVDKYIVSNGKDIFKIAKQLRKEKIDFCCITGPNFTSLLIAIFSGIGSIATITVRGGVANQTRTYKLLQRFVHTIPYTYGTYVSRVLLRLLEPIDIFSDNTTKYLYFTTEAERKVEALLSSHNISKDDFVVGISPTAGHRTKQWPEESFAKVADYLSNVYGARIVIIGGPQDKKEGDAMWEALSNNTKVINTVGLLNIEELKALIFKLNLFISVDTGPIYIAEALGIATIDIAGPIDVNEQPPRGRLHKNVVPKSGKKLLFAMNVRDYDYDEVRREVESMTPEMVIEKFEELYPLIKNTK